MDEDMIARGLAREAGEASDQARRDMRGAITDLSNALAQLEADPGWAANVAGNLANVATLVASASRHTGRLAGINAARDLL